MAIDTSSPRRVPSPLDDFSFIDEWGPEKVVVVSDRKTGMRGVLVIDNSARGAGKGGTRMSPSLTVNEVARLARTMTWKWAAVDLFHGGAKAGILGDPTAPNKEGILRAFARALSNEVPSEYVFGLDMGLNEEDAAIFVDELGDRGVSTGLPRALGGLPYDKLGVTGFGVAETTQAASQQMELELVDASIAIQGFGAVGQATALRLVALGARIVSVATADGSVFASEGLDIPHLASLREQFGDACVTHYGGVLPSEATLTCEANVLIPAAREDTITDEVARTTTAKLVVEGANMPTSHSSRDILHSRGIVVVPDFIANAGGIVAAAHSTDNRNSPFVVDPASVFSMISTKLRANTIEVLETSTSAGVTSHDAAMMLAQRRVREAMQLRRQYR